MKGSGPGDTGHRWDLPFLLILAAGMAIRFVALGQQSFGYDEIDSVTSAWGGPTGSLRITFLNPRGPIYLGLLKVWMALLGHGEGTIRMLSAILGGIGLVLFYRVALRFVGRPAALIGLALLAFSPFHLWHSQMARNYVLLFDFGLIAVSAFAADVERRTQGTFVIALAATAASCLSNLSGFFLFVMFGLYAIAVRNPSRYPLRRLVLFFALSGAILWPWILEGSEATGPFHLGRPEEGSGVLAVKGESPPGLLGIPFTFFNFSLGYSAGPSIDELKIHRLPAVVPHLWYLIPAGALFALAAARGLLRIPKSSTLLIFLWCGVPVFLMIALAALNLKAPNARYALLSFAPYLLLLAVGISSIASRLAKIAIFTALMLFSVYSDYQYFTEPRYWQPDARAAGELLSREATPDDAIIVYTLEYVKFYLPSDMEIVRPLPREFANQETMEAWLRHQATNKKRVWITQCFGWWMDREDRFLDLSRKLMTHQDEWHFTKMPVYLFTTPEDWRSEGRPHSQAVN